MQSLIGKFKSKLHALIFWQTPLGDLVNNLYGLSIFYRNSFHKNKTKSQESEIAFLTKQYHIVEKGLSLPDPRKGFGKEKIELLLSRGTEYRSRYGNDSLVVSIQDCLKEYLKYNEDSGYELDSVFKSKISNFVAEKSENSQGGTRDVLKKDLISDTNIPFKEFVLSRFSVRNFDNKEVDLNTIAEAVDIAKHAPSVCNRQSWRAHVFKDKDQIFRLLKLQGGNNGFTKAVNKLIIVTTDTKAFTTLENNQVYVDGGIFSMNLVLALHHKGLGACCLNTCFPFTTEKEVKKIAEISKSERLIMMIAVGNLKESYKVAVSKKKSLSEILIQH